MIELQKNGRFIIPREECFIGYRSNEILNKSFFIENLTDISLTYTLTLRFENGIENYFLLDSELTYDGTRLEWTVSDSEFSFSGLSQICIHGKNSSGIVFKSEFVTIYIDNAIKFIASSADIDAVCSMSF